MYLNKKQVKAIEIALEALDYGIRCDVQQEDSIFATDILANMLNNNRKTKQRLKNRNEWNKRLSTSNAVELNGENIKKLFLE